MKNKRMKVENSFKLHHFSVHTSKQGENRKEQKYTWLLVHGREQEKKVQKMLIFIIQFIKGLKYSRQQFLSITV